MKGSTKGTIRLLIGVAGTFVLMQTYHVAALLGIDRDLGFLLSALVVTLFNRWYWRTMDMALWPRTNVQSPPDDELPSEHPTN